MEMENIQMQIQSYLCQLRVKELEEIDKTLGYSGDDTRKRIERDL